MHIGERTRAYPDRVVGDSARAHAFLSYVREDRAKVDRLQRILETAGIPVWRDTNDLWPGEDWRIKIRQAITRESLVFVACFSNSSMSRATTYQNEELLLAVEQFRLRPPTTAWLIPVRLEDCRLPQYDLGAGRTLDSLQRVDLIDDDWDTGAARLVSGVLRVVGTPPGSSLTLPISVERSAHAAADTVKRELAGAPVAISAHDAIRREIERIRTLDLLKADPQRTGYDQIEVVERFLSEARVLAALVATAAYWGAENSDQWWLNDINRLARRPLLSGSLAVLDRPRLPALVIAWAAGIAAVTRDRVDLLTRLFSLPSIRDPGSDNDVPAVLAAAPEWLHVADGLGYLYRLLRPVFVDELVLGREAFIEGWERWQYLLLLASSDLRDRRNTYVPMGRGGIRVDGHDPALPVPYSWIRTELSRLREQHPLLAAGFFEGKAAELERTNDAVANSLAKDAEQADRRLLPPKTGGALPSGLHYPGSFSDDPDYLFGPN